MSITAYPLQWPNGWARAGLIRATARFSRKSRSYSGQYAVRSELTINDAVGRVRLELQRMGISYGDQIISTNLELRLDGFPRSGQREPCDPGAAVYWRTSGGDTRCMAIDRYDRVADNLAAIAATLDAMRAIERHGGAEVLDRAFTGFTALPSATSGRPWHVVLSVPAHASTELVRDSYRRGRSIHHPDRGGDATTFNEVQSAWAAFCAERGIAE